MSDLKKGKKIVFKPRNGRGSRNVSVVSDQKEYQAIIDLLNARSISFIAQEHIEGEEYSIFIAKNQINKVYACVPVLIIEKRGITTKGIINHNCDVVKQMMEFCEVIEFNGWINVQGILDYNSTFKIFEINPRMSTTTVLALHSNPNLVEMLISGECSNSIEMGKNKLTLQRTIHSKIYQNG